jgi:hypothetical protein
VLFIDGKLAGDTTLTSLLGASPAGYSQNIYYQSAPAGAGYPLVILNKQSGVPTQAMTDPSALDTDVWLVKAIDHSPSADTAEAVAARIRTLLNDASLSISGETLLYLRRVSDVDYEELSSGETYKHSGSLWRLVVDP